MSLRSKNLKARYDPLFDEMLDAICYCQVLFDDNGCAYDIVYLEVNDAFQTITGLKAKDVIGKKATEVLKGFRETNPELIEIAGRVASTGEKARFEGFWAALKKWFVVSMYSPQKGYYVCVFDDVTQRRNMEDALRESNEFNTSILNNCPNPVLVINPDTSIRYVNPALERLTGCHSEELVGFKSPREWLPNTLQDPEVSDWQDIPTKQIEVVEKLLKNKSDNYFWIEVNSVPVIHDGVLRYYVILWNDITEQKELRENLRHYITEATKAQEEERKRMARYLHDETVQTIASLYTRVDNIIMTNPNLSREVIRELRKLRKEIDDAMEGVRLSSYQLRPGLLDQLGLVPSLKALVKEANIEGNVKYSFRLVGHERRISSDVELILFRISQEALRNIRKHSRATTARLTATYSEDKVVLVIDDNGAGFRPPRLLGSYARKGKLGLIGIEERVTSVKGKLTIESELGMGTKIIVEVPIVAD
jgi:PAS domain S-box-containing protein